MEKKEVAVSVFIGTYNQEDYIRDALEGALNQETDFLYEIIVHDDASTDHTGEIVKEYAEKYPDKIIALYEEVNMYAHPEYAGKRALDASHGKYAAFCDGDDYWTDKTKLQQQYDFMESHPDYSLCTHNTLEIDDKTGERKLFNPEGDMEGVPLPQEYVCEKGCSLFHSSSHFLRVHPIRQKYGINPFTFDLKRVFYSADVGKVMYLNQVMSVYRVHTKGSWSENVSNDLNHIADWASRISLVNKFDEETGYRWHNSLEKYNLQIKFSLCWKVLEFYRKFGFKKRLLILMRCMVDCFGLHSLAKSVWERIIAVKGKLRMQKNTICEGKR